MAASPSSLGLLEAELPPGSARDPAPFQKEEPRVRGGGQPAPQVVLRPAPSIHIQVLVL